MEFAGDINIIQSSWTEILRYIIIFTFGSVFLNFAIFRKIVGAIFPSLRLCRTTVGVIFKVFAVLFIVICSMAMVAFGAMATFCIMSPEFLEFAKVPEVAAVLVDAKKYVNWACIVYFGLNLIELFLFGRFRDGKLAQRGPGQ